MADTKQPTHRAYTLIPRGKDKEGKEVHFWLNIGSAFAHADGEGFNIILEALPIHNGGQIVLRVPKQSEPEPEPERKSYKK